MNEEIIINKNIIQTFNILHLKQYVTPNEQTYFDQSPGTNVYQLLAYLSNIFNNITIFDIGTRYGSSAIALSYNINNFVISLDTDKHYINHCKENIKLNNIQFECKNIIYDHNKYEILNAKLIYLDIDPHNGDEEKIMVDFLIQNNYTGIVICDDIGPSWPLLHNWWNTLNISKYDLTEIGHYSGTGLIPFNYNIKII